jgi:uncharacterized protein (DUF433 family)
MSTDTSWIEENPDVCGGDACIRNTQHTVQGLVEWKLLGQTEERILEHHPDLSRADLRAAWEYEESHREEIERAIQADAEA